MLMMVIAPPNLQDGGMVGGKRMRDRIRIRVGKLEAEIVGIRPILSLVLPAFCVIIIGLLLGTW
jgi:hypothetical protein